jgi:hypothetical protein
MRPRYLPREKLRGQLTVYLTGAEREEIDRKATDAGLGLSAYIREAALGHRVQAVPSGNIEHWRELARVGANLNQLAYAINAGKASGVDLDTIRALAEQVRLLRLDLTGSGT